MTDVKIEKGKKGMLRAVQKYFADIPPVFLNGCIAVLIAVMTALNMSLATDESAKYISAELRFWLLVTVGSTIQGMHALSKFRDVSYGSHMEGKRLEAEDIKNELRRHPPSNVTE